MADMGRPLKPIDWNEVSKLCHIQCTEEEIAAFLEVAVDTLARRCKAENNCTFKEFSGQKRKGGRVSLRRSQWLNATKKENVTMQIWLGKQYLSQSDKQETTGSIENSINLNYKLKDNDEK